MRHPHLKKIGFKKSWTPEHCGNCSIHYDLNYQNQNFVRCTKHEWVEVDAGVPTLKGYICNDYTTRND